MQHVTAYNKISRVLELKPSTCFGGVDKGGIQEDIRSMKNSNREAFFDLLSKLVAIKCYRQTGFLFGMGTKVEVEQRQNQLWTEIEQGNLQPTQHTGLPELMAFIKNDGLIIQKKIPAHFKELLNPLSDDEKTTLLSKFSDQERDLMRGFLSGATGTDWSPRNEASKLLSNTNIQPPKNTIMLVGTSQKIAKQIGNNYNSAALCTVALHSQCEIPDFLKNAQEIFESAAELETRTPKGLVNVAQKMGLIEASQVQTSSVADYGQCIHNSLKKGRPLIAPFLVDAGWDLGNTRSLAFGVTDYMGSNNNRFRGHPITKQVTVTGMGRPIKELVDASETFNAFQASVSNLANLGDNKISKEMIHNPDNLEGNEFREKVIKPIREKEMAIKQFGSLIKGMTEQTFLALKNGSMNMNDFIVNGDLAHACVITGYNPDSGAVTIVHWNRTYTTTAANLYASSQLLPEEHKGGLYTFLPESSNISDSSII